MPILFRQRRPHRRGRPSRPLSVQTLEGRRLLAATPLGATASDTAEFLLGTVAVTPVLFESDGSIDAESQDWSEHEIDQLLSRVADGVNWWSDTLDALGTVHSLDFVIDDTYARDPFQTGYEGIDRPSHGFELYAGEFLTPLGYSDADSLEDAVRQFNHDQRVRLGTDWSFTIFVVDSSDDRDGAFAEGGNFSTAFAYPGGLFMVLPSSRPASTVTHEMGHVFWARDEYPGGGSWTDRRGYYNAQNLNAADNPTAGFVQEDSIMRGGEPLASAYAAHSSPASTLALLGWRDSDGDGIFDLADVPLQLELAGYFDSDESVYHVRGSASAIPLRNENSSGLQSDITLNEISRLQYSLDEGPWLTATEPQQPTAEFDISVAITDPFSAIRWRVIDENTGVTSAIVTASDVVPAISDASSTGYAFLDANRDGNRDSSETLLENVTAVIRQLDGSPLADGQVVAEELSEGEVQSAVQGAVLSAEGLTLSGAVGVFASAATGDAGTKAFHAYDAQQQQWIDSWSQRRKFSAAWDQPVGRVQVVASGVDAASYLRIEAYDSSGSLIERRTSNAIPTGQTESLSVHSERGAISSIRVFGHASTSVALTELTFGFDDEFTTDASGTWAFPDLPDGDYQVQLTPASLIHAFEQPTAQISVTDGQSTPLAASAQRVTSPRHNSEVAADVDQSGGVSALDALLVINDLNRYGSRTLAPHESTGDHIDVNDDGHASALDALLIINALNRDRLAEAEGERTAKNVDQAIVEFAQSPQTTKSEAAATRSVPQQLVSNSYWSGFHPESDDFLAGHTQQPSRTVPHVPPPSALAWTNQSAPLSPSETVPPLPDRANRPGDLGEQEEAEEISDWKSSETEVNLWPPDTDFPDGISSPMSQQRDS